MLCTYCPSRTNDHFGSMILSLLESAPRSLVPAVVIDTIIMKMQSECIRLRKERKRILVECIFPYLKGSIKHQSFEIYLGITLRMYEMK